MAKYELTFILEPGLKKTQKDKVLQRIKDWFTKGKVKVLEETEWGMRSLAYPIRKFQEGFYYFFVLETTGNFAKILQEGVELENKILRYLLVRVEK